MFDDEFNPDLEGDAHRESDAIERNALAVAVASDDFWQGIMDMYWLVTAPVVEPAPSLHQIHF